MDVLIDKSFAKQLEITPSKVQQAFRKRISLFHEQPFHPLLHNHPLIGKYFGRRSINITGDWRALYIEKRTLEKIIAVFRVFGTHSQL